MKKILSLVLTSALVSSYSHAEIELSGFASIVGGITTSSDEELHGFDDSFNFNQGSMFALQATSDLGDKLGATVQILAKGDNDWEPEFNWAFLSYDATDDLRILAGRQRIPFYLYSDYLDVSYAFPWITPIESAYASPFDVYNGIGAIYNTSFGDVDATFHGMYGNNNGEVPGGGSPAPAKLSDMVGLASTFNYDWLTFRVAAFVFNTATIDSANLNGLAQSYRNAGEAINFDVSKVAENIEVVEDSVEFIALGLQMTFDSLNIVAEYTDLALPNTPLAEGTGYYIMASYQVTDSVLVHVTYDYDEKSATLDTSSIPFGTSDTLDTLKMQTAGFLARLATEKSAVTLGVRYDFHDSAALKFEYKDYSDELNSDNDAGLFRAAVVTVF